MLEQLGKGTHLGDVAFFDFVMFASTEDEILNHYKEDTGIDLLKRKSSLDDMIDKATGYNPAEKFVDWLIINYWGLKDEDI